MSVSFIYVSVLDVYEMGNHLEVLNTLCFIVAVHISGTIPPIEGLAQILPSQLNIQVDLNLRDNTIKGRSNCDSTHPVKYIDC